MLYDFLTFKCPVEMPLMKEMVTLNKKRQNRLIVLNRLELCQLFLGAKVE
ncbi:MAG: hypothetical protein WB564_08490 [Dehalococcoidia bacterium]